MKMSLVNCSEHLPSHRNDFRFAHLEKCSLIFQASSFAILAPYIPNFFMVCYRLFVDYHVEVQFDLVRGQNSSKCSD